MPITIPKHEPIKKIYVEMVRQIVESEAKNDEDHRGEIMIIFAGYTKKMEEFLKTNPGRTSRVPNKFVFESMKLHMLIQ